jgi:hypothetical protein
MTMNPIPIPVPVPAVVMVADQTGSLWKRRMAAIFLLLVVLLVGGVSLMTAGAKTGGTWWSKELLTTTEKQSDADPFHHAVDIGETVPVDNITSSSIVIEDVGSTKNNDSNYSNNNNNETCVTPELIGNWVYEEHPNLTNPICCDPRTQYPRDHEFCPFINVSATSEADLYPLILSESAHIWHGCKAMVVDMYVDHVSEKPMFWKSPNLPPWDATEFCHLLGPHRRIILVGDSTMNQAAATLMNAVHRRVFHTI